MSDLALGARLMGRLDQFARHSDDSAALSRLYLSPSHRAAVDELRHWMQQAGLATRLDGLGTLIGRYEGTRREAPVLLVGSHIDTVRQAGKYDGALGVLAALTAVEVLAERGERLDFAVEIVAFGDEEGVRFASTLRGSRALAGTLDPASLDECDAQGRSVRQELSAWGLRDATLADVAMQPEHTLGFVEVHIEQGPVLERMGRPLGVVTAISGARRLRVTVSGVAGHAGTSPMNMRRDSLTAACEMVLAVERLAGQAREVVATVGQITAYPGAANVIPGQTQFTIDARAPSDDQRDALIDQIISAIEGIAARRGLAAEIQNTHTAPATLCNPRVMADLVTAVQSVGVEPVLLPSGAGHDAMAMAALCPVGMLFVRCAGGISHHPAESISLSDADIAVRALLQFLRGARPQQWSGQPS